MLRIVHLSDLHLHKDQWHPDNRNASEIVNHLKGRYPRNTDGAPKTYAVLTGDLVDDGDEEQFRRLKFDVIAPLKEHFETVAVPGNHDYAYLGNVFRKGAPKAFRDAVGCKQSVVYPDVNEDEDRKLVFVTLDSADPGGKVWFANGIIGKNQLTRLKTMLKNYPKEEWFVVVCLHHHPFLRDFGMELHDHHELMAEITQKTHLVLFGHKHKSEAFFERYNIDRMLASGKVTKPQGNGLSFRVIEIDDQRVVSVRTEEIKAAIGEERS